MYFPPISCIMRPFDRNEGITDMKKVFSFLIALTLLCTLVGCGEKEEVAPVAAPVAEAAPNAGVIDLMGSSIGATTEAVSISGTTATITAGGEYTLRGTLDNGQIVVNAAEEGARVLLHLDGVTMTNATEPCILVQQCDKLKLILDEGSANVLTSGTEGELVDAAKDASGGVIFSEDDLDFEGSGKLELRGYINNGVTCKDDLAVQGGEITVIAANNGLRGSESVEIEGGKLTVTALGDGIKSTSAKKENKGYVSLSGGEVEINCGGDGIAAETQLLITGGSVRVTTTGAPEVSSAKALKGLTGVMISGGSFTLDTTDHCVRSGGDMEISGGSFSLRSTMGRGFSAKGLLHFSGQPQITVDAIEDGLYSEREITVEGGSFSIAAGEDGIHAGQSGSGQGIVTLNGGDILISAYQDAIDAKVALHLNGGNLLACGKSKTVKLPSEQSSQNSITCAIGGHTGSQLLITDVGGATVGEMNAVYPFTSVLFSRAGLGRCQFSCDGATVSEEP